MCKSLAEGGQRCASHTRARLTKIAQTVEAAVAAGDTEAVFSTREQWMTAAAEYASTTEGHRHFAAQRDAAEAAGQYDTAAMLNTVVAKGDALRAANRETAALIAAVRMGEASAPLVPATAEMAVAPAAPPAVQAPELSEREREQWTRLVGHLKDAAAYNPSFRRGGSFDDLVQSFKDIDATLANPASSDTDIAAALSAYDRSESTLVVQYPEFEVGLNAEARYYGGRDPEAQSRLEAARGVWKGFTQTFQDAQGIQKRRALRHPNAGPETYTALSDQPGMRRDLTARADCPENVLNEAMRARSATGDGPTGVHADGWQRARDLRMGNPSLALTLAAKDPDSWQRNEAVNQLVMTPLDEFSEKDRSWLAANLHQIPNPANQKVLAQSLAAFAKSYSDDAEKERLREILSGRMSASGTVLGDPASSDLSAEVRAIGETIGATPVDLVRQEPKKRRFLARS